jgi:YidC/Oxa1 family membrane protein insertase
VDPQQQKIQRVMLYGSPLLLAVFGLKFPIAVLVYWLTTNTWSMGQQFFILRKMPPTLGPATASSASSGATAQATKVKGLRKGAAVPIESVPKARLTQKRQLPTSLEKGEDVSDVQAPAADEAPQAPPEVSSNGSSNTTKPPGGASTGRTVSGTSGSANRPRPTNRPTGKPKGKGPRKGGRR